MKIEVLFGEGILIGLIKVIAVVFEDVLNQKPELAISVDIYFVQLLCFIFCFVLIC